MQPPARPLSLLFVVHGFPPHTSAGTEVYTLGLAQALQRLGHEVTVLARAPADRPVGEGGLPDWSLVEGEFRGLRVWRVIRRVEGLPIGESYRPAAAVGLFRGVLERLRPDVVHFQHLLHLSVDLPRVARELGLPTLITCNDYWALCARVQLIRPDGVRCDENQGMGCLVCIKGKPNRLIPAARRWFPLVTPFLLRSSRIARDWLDLRDRQEHVLGGFAAADVLIAPSRFLRQKLLDTGRFDPERVIHSGYGMRTEDAPTEAKLPDPAQRLRIGCVGSLVWYKGVDVLVEAMNRLAGRACVLKVFGDFKPKADEHHRRLEALARSGNVEFRGRFENHELAGIYRELDVLVVPSVWFENAPLAIQEAFLQRTPVVTSDIGGMAELVTHGQDGLCFRVGDAEDLARSLRRLMDEPGLLAQLSARFPPVKSLAENARELEQRYRALISSVRP